MSRSVGIIGTGKAVPKKIFRNEDFVKRGLDTSDEWIVARTGIKQRYIGEEETSSELAIEAARLALQDAGIRSDEVDAIVVATTTPDFPAFPSVACLVQRGLEITDCAAFDLSAACTGFIYAIDVAAQMMKGEGYRHILVIGVDMLSKMCDWSDRGTVILFGDGAGAVVLGEVNRGFGLLSSKLGARGQDYDKLMIPIGGSKTPLTAQNISSPGRFIQMDGKAVYRFAVNIIVEVVEKALSKVNLKKEDISFFIPHQANERIIQYAAEKLGLSQEQVYVNIATYGNTSAASIPIAIDEASRKGLLHQGDILVTVGFGAGLTFGTNVIKWAKQKK